MESRSLDRMCAAGLSLHLLPPCMVQSPFMRLDQQDSVHHEISSPKLRIEPVQCLGVAILGNTLLKVDSDEGVLSSTGYNAKGHGLAGRA